jgi:hypothetical protein
MSCATEYYKLVLQWMGGEALEVWDFLVRITGTPLLAVFILAVLSIPLTLLFHYSLNNLLPGLFQWYYGETIVQKALDWYRRTSIGTGMTHFSAKVAVCCGAAFYFLMRLVAAFPAYYKFSIGLLTATFIAVAFIGYAVGGNVPANDQARWRYFKRFQSPTVTGLGLGICTILLDFAIKTATLGLELLERVF